MCWNHKIRLLSINVAVRTSIVRWAKTVSAGWIFKNILNFSISNATVILQKQNHKYPQVGTDVPTYRINPWLATLFTKRRHEIVINRWRIGHSWLTHRFLVRREVPDQRTTCEEALTVKHVLLYCRNYANTRASVNIPDHLYEALGPDHEN